MLNSDRFSVAHIVTNRSRTHLTAWLGLIAMWLIVSAPIISQLLVSAEAHQHAAAACTQMQMGDMPMDEMHMGKMHMTDGCATDSGHHASNPTMAACGYCNLLATHAVMPAPAPAAESAFMLIMFAAAPVLSTRFTPIGAFPSGRPRAPPVVS